MGMVGGGSVAEGPGLRAGDDLIMAMNEGSRRSRPCRGPADGKRSALAAVRSDGQRLPLVPGREPGLVVGGGDGQRRLTEEDPQRRVVGESTKASTAFLVATGSPRVLRGLDRLAACSRTSS